MAVGVQWPAALPQTFRVDGASIEPQENVIRETMDVGPPKTRRRASVSWVRATNEMLLTDAQRRFFHAFYRTTLFHGTRPFQKRDDDGVLRDYFMFAPPRYSQDMSIWPYWRCQLSLEYID